MKIVLLGDSIRLGYGPSVEQYFREKGYDFYQPQDNCRFAKYFLRLLFDEKENLKDADVIHFNIGHWDLCKLFGDETFSTLDEYRANLAKITQILRQITPNLIFATTTPVKPENPHNDNKSIEEFNRVAVEVMKENGVKINDLYGLLKDDINKYICDDLIHLTPAGIDRCKEQVIKMIEEAK